MKNNNEKCDYCGFENEHIFECKNDNVCIDCVDGWI